MNEEKKFIDFNYDWQILDVELDLNQPRVKQHLKALLRGYGSTTETIMIDFIKETFDCIKTYSDIEDAWNRLDKEQKKMISGFRSLLNESFLCDSTSECFPEKWFRKIVANEYEELTNQYINSGKCHEDKITLDEKTKMAIQAEKNIRNILNIKSNKTTWVIEDLN